jgi:succinate dehydrogenase / fumarate reductase cytochrome b subunit
MMRFLKSTLGKKFLVALTGAILFIFVVGHMLVNLKLFLGVDPETGIRYLDLHAVFLRQIGADLFGGAVLLWMIRIVLLISLVLHVILVTQLALRNTTGRPVAYQYPVVHNSNLASRSMFLTGIVVLVFLVYHLLHLSLGTMHFQGFAAGQVFNNLVRAFGAWGVAVLYVAAMAVLGLHLYHAIWSFFQTFGLDNPDRNALLRWFAAAAAAIVFIGFVSVPVAVVCRFVG